MGVHGEIACPSCGKKLIQRLGAGEEGLWGAYAELAQRELGEECSEGHPTEGAWRFLKSPEWAQIERSYYGGDSSE